MELFGTHGTTKNRSRKIEREGFVPGARSSKAGSGVYFWAYEGKYDVATLLAKNWWAFCNGNGWYRHDTDSQCAVVFTSISLDNESYLDCTDLSFQEELYEIAATQGVASPNDVAALYSKMVSDLELELGQDYTVIKASVPVPTPTDGGVKQKKLLNWVYSHYDSYVVRKNYSETISIDDVKYF